jgi:hypothetical protein
MEKTHVTIAQSVESGGALVSITFVYGKGAAFWGPYTIHAVVPTPVVKRLAYALHMAVQRYEQAFGVLETDVQRRVIHQQATKA